MCTKVDLACFHDTLATPSPMSNLHVACVRSMRLEQQTMRFPYLYAVVHITRNVVAKSRGCPPNGVDVWETLGNNMFARSMNIGFVGLNYYEPTPCEPHAAHTRWLQAK